MSTPKFSTAHTGCAECEAVVAAALAYIAAGGRLSGRWGSSVRNEHSTHWAEHKEGRDLADLTPADARELHAALGVGLGEGDRSSGPEPVSEESSDAGHALGDEVPGRSGEDVPEPGAIETSRSVDERFSALIGQVLGDFDGDTRRLEREMAERDEVYVLAFEQIEAALQQVAEVVRPLLDLQGIAIEDLKALLNGTAEGVYLTWAQSHSEGRCRHEL